ncbi:MAG: hypothetical protein K2W95_33635 [Candidatus Obscuribacterales bacterium]|nr:hypothetical protein [Candidatus Obscuribacterales bacterium]
MRLISQFTFTMATLMCILLQGAAIAGDKNSAPDDFKLASAGSAAPAMPPLQCGVQVRQKRLDPNFEFYTGSQNYYQASFELANQRYKGAADCYKRAGDAFQNLGEYKAMANARYGEAGALMMLKDNVNAHRLFGEAQELFRKYDPYSPFLKASMDYGSKLEPKLKGDLKSNTLKGAVDSDIMLKPGMLKPMMAREAPLPKVDSNIVLKNKITRLEDGTKIFDLKAQDFFNGSRYMLPEAAALDVKQGFVDDTIYKAFVGMDCLEFGALGANYMNAKENYRPFKSGDKTIVIGASDQFWSPVVKIKINGKEYGIAMDLPGISKNSRNVLLLTDGNHIAAIDPRTKDTWRLNMSFATKNGDFNWVKLTHPKKANKKK